jgi:extracellular factor (EF) 3-hydroxypalmitic acid methyl ester biosynthesis protein
MDTILSEVLIQHLQSYCSSQQCPKGEDVLLNELDPALYYVKNGSIEVYYTAKETKITVALIGAGFFFGEIGFFDGIPRVRKIKAVEKAEILIIEKSAVEKLRLDSPLLYGDFLHTILLSVCDKFRRVIDEREPINGYAAAISAGRESFEEAQPLPDEFLKSPEWQSLNSIIENFKSRFFNLSYRLQEDISADISEALRARAFDEFNDFNASLQQFSDTLRGTQIEDISWGYIFKEIFPYFMRSRFVERTYYKPKGYAGDFMMMEMIYRNEPDGDGKFGKVIDSWCLQQTAARAIRARRKLLGGLIRQHCDERSREQGPIRIMNLACGSNRELFDFLQSCDYSSRIEATCVDIDSEALQYTNQHVNTFSHNASIRLMNENLVRWALGKVKHEFGTNDLVYSSGLTDYLDNELFSRLINRCYQHLKPGGLLIVGNFSPDNPDRMFMDYFLRWQLIYRTEQQLQKFFVDSPFGENVKIVVEENGVNLFALAKRIL